MTVFGKVGQFMTERGSATKSIGLNSLIKAAEGAKPARGLPPVHLWDPPDCGDIDMRIAPDGSWFYMGTPIGRPAMVRLFSTILRRDGARFVLVTPVEKVGIRVDDAPFLAVELEAEGVGREQALSFRTNVEDWTDAGPDHALRFTTNPATLEPRPYVHVRGGLEALIARSVFYELVARAEPGSGAYAGTLGVWSRGLFFPIGALPEGWALA